MSAAIAYHSFSLQIYSRASADLATLNFFVEQRKGALASDAGPFLLGDRPSRGDATLMAYLVYALHAPYKEIVWNGKTLGNMVSSHRALLQYYKAVLPLLNEKGCHPEDFSVTEGAPVLTRSLFVIS